MSEKKYTIYAHRNNITGKYYIGQTCCALSVRFGSRGQRYKECPVFYAAIEKYGWENFSHIILEQNLSADQANEKEREYIQYFNSLVPNGYNISPGGQEHPYLTEETRQKMGQSIKNSWTPERKEYYRQIMSDLYSSPERRKQISNNSKQMWAQSDEQTKQKMLNNLDHSGKGAKKLRKRVFCVETNTEYPGMRDAERATGISHSNISLACSGKQQTAGGYHWKIIE